MSKILNALDMSKWGGELTLKEATDMVNAGIDCLIFGTGNSAPGGAGQFTRQQYNSWKSAGGKRSEAYIYLYFAGDPAQQIRNALQTCKGLDIARFWLDAEDVESDFLSIGARVAFLWDCVNTFHDIAGNIELGIYTGQWWWIPYMGNTTQFSQLPLYDSYYPPGASVENPYYQKWEGREYGGWASPSIFQFTGTTEFAGQSVDLNCLVEPVFSEEEQVAVNDELMAKILDMQNDIKQLQTQVFGEKDAEAGVASGYAQFKDGTLATNSEIVNRVQTISSGNFEGGVYYIKPAN